MKTILPVTVLLTMFFLLVVTSTITKSPICDEAGHHIAAGYSYVKTGDFRMNPSAPPLLRIIMGAPLLFLNLKIPMDNSSWVTINSTEFSRLFLFVYNKNADLIVFLSRLPMVLISTFLGILVFIWAKDLYGKKAGLFALLLYAFSPAILANAGLAMLDMGCALFIFMAAFQFWRYIKDKSVYNVLLCGIAFGLAQSAKFTSLVLYPLFLLLAAIDILQQKNNRLALTRRAIWHILLIFLTGIFVLWATYGFEFKPLLRNAPDIEEKVGYIKKIANSIPFLDGNRAANTAVYFAKNVPIPLSAYMVSFSGIAKSFTVGDQSLFFMGHALSSGSKIYYAVLYFIRTPLASLLLLFSAIFLFKRRSKIGTLGNLFLILPIILIFLAASFSKLQGGLRYILPMYPFLFVWMGGLVTAETKKIASRVVFYLLCFWYILASIAVYPHYLAYFNELVGGPGGFGYKITSDGDWGQDFKELKRYMDKHDISSIRLLCFGTADPAYYGIQYENPGEEELEKPIAGKYYAISSRSLSGVKWADKYKPIDKVAYNISIYHVKDGEDELKK
ncbi:MAG: glycosyltransferase family 39 protein [Candidatus Omnitrophica bacterium]|nr:glycosyltransferase family 39 protein [Candidatus Omnitrophota bacterium]